MNIRYRVYKVAIAEIWHLTGKRKIAKAQATAMQRSCTESPFSNIKCQNRPWIPKTEPLVQPGRPEQIHKDENGLTRRREQSLSRLSISLKDVRYMDPLEALDQRGQQKTNRARIHTLKAIVTMTETTIFGQSSASQIQPNTLHRFFFRPREEIELNWENNKWQHWTSRGRELVESPLHAWGRSDGLFVVTFQRHRVHRKPDQGDAWRVQAKDRPSVLDELWNYLRLKI